MPSDSTDVDTNSLDFDSLLPNAPFGELHSRLIDAPIEDVWESFLELTGNEIRLLKPLFTLRGLPALMTGKRGPMPTGDRAALELFEDEGFVMLRRDEHPVDGRALVIFGTAGRFWSPAHNPPRTFDSTEDFLQFDEPGNAKTVARFEAWEEDGRTRLETETVVAVTDPASKKKFAAYWTIIRGPSGLLRRSWLAGVDRRVSSTGR